MINIFALVNGTLVNYNKGMFIGLTGLNASGKGTAADHLKDLGFSYFSLSDIVREEATALGMDHSRESLIYTGNKLRTDNGPSVLAKRTAEKIIGQNIKNAVIDSIRNLKEVEELRKLDGFILVAVDAPVEIRFKRAKKRGRVGFEKYLQEFIDVEQKENSSDPNKQNLFECIKQADVVIVNDGTPKQLISKVEELLIVRR